MAKKTAVARNKSSAKKTVKTTESKEARKLKSPRYKHFRLQKRLRHPKGKPVSAWALLKKTGRLLKACWKPLLILVLAYAAIQLLLVYGLKAPLNVVEFKDSLRDIFEGEIDNLSTATATLSALFSSQSETAGENSGVYSGLLTLFFGMIFVWIYRQKTAGNRFTVMQAVYRSPYPVTVLLGVLVVIALQAIPFAIGSLLFSTVMQGGIAVGGYEKAVWWIFLGLTGLLSAYMISSSVFALFISTLPNMTPMKALRSARNLVRYRRFSVISRFLGAAIIAVLAVAGLMLPLIFFVAPIAGWVYFLLTVFALPAVVAFGYTLYRELL